MLRIIIYILCFLVMGAVGVLLIHSGYKEARHIEMMDSMKLLAGWAENLRRMDRDGNGRNDYWTDDLAGAGSPWSHADGNTAEAYEGHRSSPFMGCWLFNRSEEDALDIIAVPHQYRVTGDHIYLVQGFGRIQWWNPGRGDLFEVRPEIGVSDTDGVLTSEEDRLAPKP